MISITVFIKGNHFFHSFLYAGLERLKEDQLYSIRYVYPWQKTFRPSASDIILSMEVSNTAANKKRICFDLSDFNDLISQEALAGHDLYFKRSYCADKYVGISEGLRNKIKPFGLMFACKYSHGCRALLNLLAGFAPNKSDAIRVKTKIGQWFNYAKFPPLPAYESRRPLPGNGIILFQTRAWNPSNHPYWREVNESRLQVILALKTHFRERFTGGFMPDRFSRKHYPHALTSFPTSRGRYVQMVKTASVCVYTHGLFQSPAFKLGEYLAGGRCIVAEPIVNELPTPLQDGRHFLSFTTAESCVAKCEGLLQDVSQAEEMMRQNSDYYWRHVEPSQQLRDAIKTACTGLS